MWHKPKDKLPPEDKMLLLYIKCVGVIDTGWYNTTDKHKWNILNHCYLNGPTVDAWMLIPDPEKSLGAD